MQIFHYVRSADDFLRSIEASSSAPPPSSGPRFEAMNSMRDYFVVHGDDGTRIRVPLMYLADTARIEVAGNCSCTLKGENYFEVLIVNGARIPPQAVSLIDETSGQLTDQATERVFDKNFAGKVKNSVYQKVHPTASQVAREIGQGGSGLSITQNMVNRFSNAVSNAGRAVAKQGLQRVVRSLVRGAIGAVIEAASAEETGHMATYVGRTENGCSVVFQLTGSKPRVR